MTARIEIVLGLAMSAVAMNACGGAQKTTSGEQAGVDETAPAGGLADVVVPDAWADWKSFTNVSPGAWQSKTHGNRFVEIYVNDIALEAYKTEGAELPVGSIVVKPSWENEDGKPGAEGPLFVMEKMAAGYAPDSGDWKYVFQWKDPPEKWAAKLGSNVDWQSPSEKVEYCSDCHDVMERQLGMPPEDRRAQW